MLFHSFPSQPTPPAIHPSSPPHSRQVQSAKRSSDTRPLPAKSFRMNQIRTLSPLRTNNAKSAPLFSIPYTLFLIHKSTYLQPLLCLTHSLPKTPGGGGIPHLPSLPALARHSVF